VEKLHNFLASRYMTMAMGIILIFCGLMEIVETSLEAFFDVEIGAHHAVIVIGIQQILLSITHVVEGTTKNIEVLEETTTEQIIV
jgi:hypothetical protein